jgi:hypothetical protein
MSHKPVHMLISLKQGYGLGDAAQMSAVLRHVVAARPSWVIDFCATAGRHTAGHGIVRNTFTFDDPAPASHYDREVEIILYDSFHNWADRPNTRVSSCLHERFGLPWVAELGRYQLNVTEAAFYTAFDFLYSIRAPDIAQRKAKVVAVHYQGDSSKDKKDLTHLQAEHVCNHIMNLRRMPVLLDWRNTSPLTDMLNIPTVGRIKCADDWGKNCMMNAALISQCEAFVGIDSGPAKCASATDTPTLVTWIGHHPAPFHDPAPNTTHNVPTDYHGLEPVCNSPGVIEFFEKNYNVRKYDGNPVKEIKQWLTEQLTS